jgi:hypothetical protein
MLWLPEPPSKQDAVISGYFDAAKIAVLDVTPLSQGIETVGGVMTEDHPAQHRNSDQEVSTSQLFRSTVLRSHRDSLTSQTIASIQLLTPSHPELPVLSIDCLLGDLAPVNSFW